MLLKANTWYARETHDGKLLTYCTREVDSALVWFEIDPPTITPVKRTLASHNLKPGMRVMLDKRPNPYTVVAIFDGAIVFGHEGMPLIVAGLNDFYQVGILHEDPPKQLTVEESLKHEHVGKTGMWRQRNGAKFTAVLTPNGQQNDIFPWKLLSINGNGRSFKTNGAYGYDSDHAVDLVEFLGWL